MADVDNLSPIFISRLKILFDILDETRSGSVRLSDIESHWDGNSCVIPGSIVIQSLRNVASPSGRLSFDTLIMGLERALTMWKSNNSGTQSIITTSVENRRLSPGNKSNSTRTHKAVSSRNDRSTFDSGGHHHGCVSESSDAWNGLLLKSADAEYRSDAKTLRANIHDKNFWQHDRMSAGDSGGYAHVQKRTGNHLGHICTSYRAVVFDLL